MRKLILVVTTVSALRRRRRFRANRARRQQRQSRRRREPGRDESSSPVNATPTPTPSAANKPRSASVSDFLQLQSSDMLTSNLVGLDLYDGQRNDLGKIKDVAFDPSKKIAAYIVAVGGVLGVGARYVVGQPRRDRRHLRHKRKGLARVDERDQG